MSELEVGNDFRTVEVEGFEKRNDVKGVEEIVK